ncbi:MAG TPA: hypothetical protein VGQ46_19735 [Thermoanaerobaculia bacterium]|jgi:hypothetical protein|nr:hypothetical protein [Thermoanaerobaculia bacterium]
MDFQSELFDSVLDGALVSVFVSDFVSDFDSDFVSDLASDGFESPDESLFVSDPAFVSAFDAALA